ncbi:MAG: beta-ketoacyl-[acyl-carrier-protein] synthase family protein [Deltaproteobacteria bacterium]|nr:MAG: beta-ketoacyl-[acyl-carrier-protein] synthase family protein [Deltaproteobacteria bacterium]
MTRVAITGMAAVSPFGLTADALWDGLLSGRSAVRPIARFVAGGLPVTTGGEVPLEAADHERDVAISRRPIRDALAQAGLAAGDTALVWANGLDTFAHDGGELVERSAGACFSALAAEHASPRRMIATACASATQAIGTGFRLIRAGRARACVAGGATVMLTPHYALGFAWLQALALDQAGDPPAAACKPFDRMRRGFALAEGGAALVLESLDAATARGAEVLGEVIGFGASQDAFDLNRPPPDGAGAKLCMRRALADAGLTPDAVAAISAHGTGTRAGDPAEAAAVRRVFGDRALPVTSIKGAIGHQMAGAGASQAVAAVASCRTGLVPPTCNLSDPDDGCTLDHVIGRPRSADVPVVLVNSFGMGGQNATVIYARYPR